MIDRVTLCIRDRLRWQVVATLRLYRHMPRKRGMEIGTAVREAMEAYDDYHTILSKVA